MNVVPDIFISLIAADQAQKQGNSFKIKYLQETTTVYENLPYTIN